MFYVFGPFHYEILILFVQEMTHYFSKYSSSFYKHKYEVFISSLETAFYSDFISYYVYSGVSPWIFCNIIFKQNVRLNNKHYDKLNLPLHYSLYSSLHWRLFFYCVQRWVVIFKTKLNAFSLKFIFLCRFSLYFTYFRQVGVITTTTET